jgi:hypothetical protein
VSANALGKYLLKDERILWSGKPAQGFLLTGRDWFLIPFSLLWAGFAVFWESSVIAAQGPLFMKLFGAPFVLLGLYFTLGRFLLDARLREGTEYVLTNKRLLIHRSAPFLKFTALSLDRLPEASLSEGADGRGTIRFGEALAFGSRSNGFDLWTPSLDPVPQLIGIEGARDVFDKIQRASLPADA